MAAWQWSYGIQKIEFWNEPDLGGFPCINASTWLEHLTLRSMAIQDAYADFNSDLVSGARICPPNGVLLGTCSSATGIQPIVVSSAFADGYMTIQQSTLGTPPSVWANPSSTYSNPSNLLSCFGSDCTNLQSAYQTVCSANSNVGCYFGAQTVFNEHLLFPPYADQTNVTWYNSQAFSFHSYGKTGLALAQTSNVTFAPAIAVLHDAANVVAANAAGTGSQLNKAVMPLLITEHQAHTNAQWSTYMSNGDMGFEASRLASQIVNQAALGFESYIFKLTMSPASSSIGGVAKSGLHWADNSAAPYPVGDTSLMGEAAAQIVPYLLNTWRPSPAPTPLPLGTCSLPSLSGTNFLASGGYLSCLMVVDGSLRHIFVVNDVGGGSVTGPYATGASTDPTINVTGLPVTVTFNLAGLGLAANSPAVITEVSVGGATQYWGEVSLLTTVPSAGIIAHSLPPFGVMRLTVSTSAPLSSGSANSPAIGVAIASNSAVSLVAGANSNTNFVGVSGQELTVGTNSVGDNDLTQVALIHFDITGHSKAAANGNNILFEITLSSATSASQGSALSLIGLNPCAANSAPITFNNSTITWNGAPWAVRPLATSKQMATVADNFVVLGGLGSQGQVLNALAGHLSINTAASCSPSTGMNAANGACYPQRVDVTQYVAAAAAGGLKHVSFLIARRLLKNGICTSANCMGLSCVSGVCTPAQGNTAGPYPADDLDGGATVSFFGVNTAYPPTLRIIADSQYTGDITVASPWCAVPSPDRPP